MKNLDIALLLDFYGEVLTPKQREAIDFYYNEDLSLAEIGSYEGITRQGVRDSIKRGEAVLLKMEEKLGLASRFQVMQRSVDRIVQCAKDIQYFNDGDHFNRDIAARTEEIRRLAEGLHE